MDDALPTPPDPWPHLRDVISLVVTLFGLPSSIATHVALPRRMRNDIRAWLSACEALARRMVLILAASLPKPNAPAPGKAARRNMDATHGRAGFGSDDSADWSVSFRMFPSVRRAKRVARTGTWNAPPEPRASQQQIDARPLAERLEALIRLTANPEAYAKRVARRLYAEPQRAQRVFKAVRGGFRASPVATMLAEIEPLAQQAAAVFRDSS